MHNSFIMRAIAFAAFAALTLCGGKAEAAELNTSDFLAACAADPSLTEDPSFEDAKVTPKAFCECVAGELANNKLSQKDVDMLTKMHKQDISDADVESYPTLEDLLNANEGYEDGCRTKLGLPTDTGTDMEEDMDEGMPEEEEVPSEDDNSPPE